VGPGLTLKYGRYCDPCRSVARRKPAKWVSNDRIDEALRKLYSESPDARSRPNVTMFAEKIGWPKWALLRRAVALGLARTKEKPWSEPELKVLEHFAWMSDDKISEKLRRAGYARSRVAVHLKLRRMRFKQNTPYYTANALAQAFGIDSHTVLRWVREKKLWARLRGCDRVPNQRGDIWMIHEKDVRRFVMEHPLAFDIRKVDQLWFMELVKGPSVNQPCNPAGTSARAVKPIRNFLGCQIQASGNAA
jgi:hypothetical protein